MLRINRDDECMEITGPREQVEVNISHDESMIWIIVDGITRCFVNEIPKLQIIKDK